MESDGTPMTGERRSRIPQRGDVLFEHYEVLEHLASDSLVATYRGRDHRDRSSVLIRHIAAGLLGEKDARRMVERLRPMVGRGGATLSALRDVGRQESVVFVVEACPRGTSLLHLFKVRSAAGLPALEPKEALFILSQLAEALAAVPEGSWHGDVRAERVWIDRDCVTLTGGFLLAALPGDRLAEALASASGAFSNSFAPEVREGLGGRASDRWGVASILRAALFGGAQTSAWSAGAVGKELLRLLDADPSTRPSSLEPLAAALANSTGLPAPSLREMPIAISLDVNSDDQTQIVGATLPSDTIEISLEDVESRENKKRDYDEETARQRIPQPVDKRVVGSSKSRELESAEFEILDSELDAQVARSKDLDPDLVRAALGISSREPSSREPSSREPSSREPRPRSSPPPRKTPSSLPAVPSVPPPPMAVPAAPSVSPPPLPAAPSVPPPPLPAAPSVPPPPVAASVPPTTPRSPHNGAKTARHPRPPEPVSLPTDIKPIPRPRVADHEEMSGPVLFDASKSATNSEVLAKKAKKARVAAEPTMIVQRASSRPNASGARYRSAWILVVLALLIGGLIVSASLWYRSARERDIERYQRIEQRLRELREE
jgi:hypothetical protein